MRKARGRWRGRWGTPGAQSSGRGSLPAQRGAWLVSAQRGTPTPDAFPPSARSSPPPATVGAGTGRTSWAPGWERFWGAILHLVTVPCGVSRKAPADGGPCPTKPPSALLGPWSWGEEAMACSPPSTHTQFQLKGPLAPASTGGLGCAQGPVTKLESLPLGGGSEGACPGGVGAGPAVPPCRILLLLNHKLYKMYVFFLSVSAW